MPPSAGPRATLKVRREIKKDGKLVLNEVLEKELPMDQQQADQLKSLVGDGKASVTVSRDLSDGQYSSSGRVFVSISLTCDQSVAGIEAAHNWAKHLADRYVTEQFANEVRPRLYQLGILAPPSQ